MKIFLRKIVQVLFCLSILGWNFRCLLCEWLLRDSVCKVARFSMLSNPATRMRSNFLIFRLRQSSRWNLPRPLATNEISSKLQRRRWTLLYSWSRLENSKHLYFFKSKQTVEVNSNGIFTIRHTALYDFSMHCYLLKLVEVRLKEILHIVLKPTQTHKF